MTRNKIRSRDIVIAVTMAVTLTTILAACGSAGGDGSSASSGTSVPAGDAANDSDTADTSSDDSSSVSSTTSTAPKGLQLDQLPGRIATNSIGCNNDIFANSNALCIYDPDGTDLIQVDLPGEYVSFLAWTWDGTKLLTSDGETSWILNADGTGFAERDPYQVPMSTQSPDGKWSVGTLQGDNGFWLSPAGSPRDDRQWQQVTSDPNECCSFARWSFDSRRLLYSIGFGNGVCSGLSSADIETKAVQVLVGAESSVAGKRVCAITESGRWSPDGTTVLFLDEGPGLDVTVARPMLVNADGTNLRPLIPDALANDTSVLPSGWFIDAAVWSPDGTAIALSLTHYMGSGLYIVSVDGSQIIEVTDLPVGALPMEWMAWAPGI